MSIMKFKFLDDLIRWDSNFELFLDDVSDVRKISNYLEMLSEDGNKLLEVLARDDIGDAERARYLEIQLKMMKMVTLMMNLVTRDENESLDLGRMILTFSTNNRSIEFNFEFDRDNYVAIFTGNSISLYNFYYPSGKTDIKVNQRIYPITAIEYYITAMPEV